MSLELLVVLVRFFCIGVLVLVLGVVVSTALAALTTWLQRLDDRARQRKWLRLLEQRDREPPT